MAFPVTPGWHLVKKERNIPTLLYYIPQDPVLTTKIAAFDFVNTLIWSDRGDYTVRGENNWVWRSEAIPSFLCQLLRDNWTVVIFSNYISKNFEELEHRVNKAIGDLSCQRGLFFFASLASDHNQKPNTGMWEAFVNIWEKITGTKFKLDPSSFYIGDRAADYSSADPMFHKGEVTISDEERAKLGLAKDVTLGDDSLFAARLGLNFFLPDELPPQPTPDFPPEGCQEMIIMVGQQGSGKTTWARCIADQLGYTIIANEETPGAIVIKDKKRRLKKIEDLLGTGQSLIIDATHPTRASRQELIKIAEKFHLPVKIFWVSRPGRPYNEKREKPVSEIALRTYTKYFERPSPEEGAEVVRIV